MSQGFCLLLLCVLLLNKLEGFNIHWKARRSLIPCSNAPKFGSDFERDDIIIKPTPDPVLIEKTKVIQTQDVKLQQNATVTASDFEYIQEMLQVLHNNKKV